MFSKNEALEHFSRVARDWCLKRPEKFLTKDIQIRWVMDDAQHILSSETTGEQDEQNFIDEKLVSDLGKRWDIKWICLRKGSNGLTYNKYYASADDHGRRGWYPVVFCLLLSVDLDDNAKPRFEISQGIKVDITQYKNRVKKGNGTRRKFVFKLEQAHAMLD